MIAPVIADSGTGSIVVFFPHAGGSPRFFRHLAEVLPQHRVFGVTYPGRDHLIDETPVGDMQVLADRAAGELTAQFDESTEPLLLVGHSLGAFVAYETAVALRSRRSPVIVVASGQNPPTANSRGHTGRDGVFSDADVIADVVRQNPASESIWRNAELRAFFLPTVRADYRLLGDYRPSTARIDDIRVIAGSRDREIDSARVGEWQQFSKRPIEVSVVEGGHFYLDRPDTQLAQILRAATAPLQEQGGKTDHA